MISTPTLKNYTYTSPDLSPDKSPNKSPEKNSYKSGSPKKETESPTLKALSRNSSTGRFSFTEDPKIVLDHEMRDLKAKELANEYMKTKEFIEFRDYWLDSKYDSVHYIVPDEIRSYFEKIISIYHIHLTYLETTFADSAIEVIGVTDFGNLNMILGCLIPLVTLIPYSFYRKMKLSTITVCDDIRLINEARINNFNAKYYGWHFLLSIREPEKIKRHFYDCLCYNMLKCFENFDQIWISYNPKSHFDPDMISDETSLKLMLGYLNKECMLSPMRDQFEHFYLILHYPNKMLNHHDKIIAKKAALMKEAMQIFDPSAFSDMFWEKKGIPSPQKIPFGKGFSFE